MKKKTCQGRKRENEKKEEKNLIAPRNDYV